jgi:SAM-dependent methyltransferase
LGARTGQIWPGSRRAGDLAVTEADRVRWDARHGVAEDVVPLPPDALRGREDLASTVGRALDVACGRGAVALWLARRGLVVDAVDVSPVGLAAGARRAADLPVRWLRHDLDTGLPAPGPYEVVVVQRFRAPALYPALLTALAPGGLLVVTVLSEVDEGPGPWRAPPGELLAAFGSLDVLVHREANGEASLVARRSG